MRSNEELHHMSKSVAIYHRILAQSTVFDNVACYHLSCFFPNPSAKSTKILGIVFFLSGKDDTLLATIRKSISRYQVKLNMCRTLQAKAAFLLTFVIPKIVHAARHQNIMMADPMKSQSELLRIIFPNNKFDIKAEVQYQPISKGGIGLTYLPIRVIVAKFLNFTLLRSHAPVTVNTSPDKSITKLLKHCGVQLCQGEDAWSLKSITNSENALLISPIIQFRAIYDFLVAVKFQLDLKNSSDIFKHSNSIALRYTENILLGS